MPSTTFLGENFGLLLNSTSLRTRDSRARPLLSRPPITSFMASQPAAQPAPQAPGPVPAPAPPPLPQQPEHNRQQMDDKDDDGKVSRWQIGSSSLSVLEAVYQMEPFPGACRLTPDGTAKRPQWAPFFLPPRKADSRHRRARPCWARKERRARLCPASYIYIHIYNPGPPRSLAEWPGWPAASRGAVHAAATMAGAA